MQMYVTVIFVLLFSSSIFAQHEPIQPFEELGIKVKVLTLSKGKYQESFPNDTIMRIGSVMFNHVTGEVVTVVVEDTLYGEYNLKADVVSRWLSIDPLAAKYPNWSPYVYVNDNPTIYIDPNGGFSVSIHKRMSKEVFKGFNISKSERKEIVRANKQTDTKCFECPKHFDNKVGYSSINADFISLNNRTNSNTTPAEFGEILHTTQDFYAHSNYVELYIEFYESQGNNVKDLAVDKIPTYNEASSEFKDFLTNKGDSFRTGSFTDTKLTHWLEKLGLKKEDDANDPFSHENMNKDNKDAKQGGKNPTGSNISYFKFAENVAKRATSEVLEKKYDKKEEKVKEK
jgi:hypothetical protein